MIFCFCLWFAVIVVFIIREIFALKPKLIVFAGTAVGYWIRRDFLLSEQCYPGHFSYEVLAASGIP